MDAEIAGIDFGNTRSRRTGMCKAAAARAMALSLGAPGRKGYAKLSSTLPPRAGLTLSRSAAAYSAIG